jgi:chemotaxis protein MotB
MRLPARHSFWIVPLLVVPFANGCTTMKRLEAVENQRDALAEENASLETRVQGLQTRLDNANAEVQAQGTRIQRTQAGYERLVGALGSVVAEQDIAIEQMKYGVRLDIPQDVLFATGSAQLGDPGREVLAKVAKKLVDVPYQVVVAGYSDNVPIGPSLRSRFTSNWELAAARAAEVTEYLQTQGVAPMRLVAISFGEYRPIASNDTAEGRAQNRRIELLLRPVTEEDFLSAP